MKKSKTQYNNLSDQDKQKIIQQLYVDQGKSFHDIAFEYDTYSNKIRRDAKKFGIKIRNKSEAQKNALQTGKHQHPTKGTNRSNETKEKIGLSVLHAWENMDDSQKLQRQKKARDNWDQLDENTKQDILRSANQAVRKTSKLGSKLEKSIYNSLIRDGYRVEFHKEQTLLNTKLQIDLFVPIMNLVIEIDGPSHFAPVWGEDSLSKNKKYDSKKEGLIFGKGWNLIRVIQTRDFSQARANIIYNRIVDILNQHSKDFDKGQQKFIIKDTDNG